MTALKWTLENAGNVIELRGRSVQDYLKAAGRQGFGVAPTKVYMRESVRGGSQHRRTVRQSRDIDLPLVIFGAERQEIEDRMRALTRLLHDHKTTAKLVATYPDGERVFTRVHYAGGADPQYGSSDTDAETMARWALALVAPDPYWTAETAVSYVFKSANQGRGLILDAPLSQMQLSSSQALGSATVENPGDVAVQPVWTFTGPADTVLVSLADGSEIPYNAVIAAGEIIIIDTINKKVYDQNGDEAVFSNLGDFFRFFAIPSGSSVVSVEMTNVTSDSRIALVFSPKRELVF